MKKQHTTSVSAKTPEKQAAGKTDWSRVDARSDTDIQKAMQDDPDGAGLTDFDWSTAHVINPQPKKMISIRLDEDILAFFKKNGSGYQKRINAVLKSYIQHQQNKEG